MKKVRKLLDSCRTYWDAVATPNDYLFGERNLEDVRKSVFQKLDGDGFDVEAAEYQLRGPMAKRLNGLVLSVTSQLQAIGSELRDLPLMRPLHFVPEPTLPPLKQSEPTRAAGTVPAVVLHLSAGAMETGPSAPETCLCRSGINTAVEVLIGLEER